MTHIIFTEQFRREAENRTSGEVTVEVTSAKGKDHIMLQILNYRNYSTGVFMEEIKKINNNPEVIRLISITDIKPKKVKTWTQEDEDYWDEMNDLNNYYSEQRI